MKTIILILIALTLNAGVCEVAKRDYDNNYREYRKSYKKATCNSLVYNLRIIRDHCNYPTKTKDIMSLMVKARNDECGTLSK